MDCIDIVHDRWWQEFINHKCHNVLNHETRVGGKKK